MERNFKSRPTNFGASPFRGFMKAYTVVMVALAIFPIFLSSRWKERVEQDASYAEGITTGAVGGIVLMLLIAVAYSLLTGG